MVWKQTEKRGLADVLATHNKALEELDNPHALIN